MVYYKLKIYEINQQCAAHYSLLIRPYALKLRSEEIMQFHNKDRDNTTARAEAAAFTLALIFVSTASPVTTSMATPERKIPERRLD